MTYVIYFLISKNRWLNLILQKTHQISINFQQLMYLIYMLKTSYLDRLLNYHCTQYYLFKCVSLM